MKKDARNARLVILYSFLLVATMFFSSVSADYACYEDFNDDAVGSKPTSDWYTYWNSFNALIVGTYLDDSITAGHSPTHDLEYNVSTGSIGIPYCVFSLDNEAFTLNRTTQVNFSWAVSANYIGIDAQNFFWVTSPGGATIYFKVNDSDSDGLYHVTYTNGSGYNSTSDVLMMDSVYTITLLINTSTHIYSVSFYNFTTPGWYLNLTGMSTRFNSSTITGFGYMFFGMSSGGHPRYMLLDDIGIIYSGVPPFGTIWTSGWNTFESLDYLHFPSIIIDAGATYANDSNMTLAFSCTNATSMNLSVDNSTWLPGVNYSVSGYLDVGSYCGNRTIYVRYYNASTGDYAYAHDHILFTFNSTITIIGYNETSQGWDDPNETNALTVLLNISSPNAPWMGFCYYSDTGPFDIVPLAYSTSLYYTLPCTSNGVTYVYAMFTITINTTTYYEYANDTIIMNGTVPNLAITYPLENTTYTSVQWGEDHTMTLTGITDSTFTIEMNVIGADENGNGYTFIDDDVPYLSYSIDIDLEPYVWFDDTNYTITLNVRNCFGYQNLIVNFTIGDPTTAKGVHISLKDLTPIRENFSQLERLDEGVRFDIMSTEPNGIWYRIFVSDWDGVALVEQDDNAILDINNGWQSKEYYSSRFYSRSFYKAWVLISDSYNLSDIQFDDLYGTLEVQYVSFNEQPMVHYIFNSTDLSEVNSTQTEGRYMLLTGDFTGVNTTIIESFGGVSWGFGTFAIGDVIPFHSIGSTLYDARDVYDDEWGKQFDDYGIPGLGLFIGLMVILFFSILPILITHTFPPLTIEMFFVEMGAVIAYAMGLFPVWIFEIALIALLMAIFYKIFNWYRSQSGVTSFADTPLARQGMKDAGVAAKYGKKGAKWAAPRVGKALHAIGIGKKVRY